MVLEVLLGKPILLWPQMYLKRQSWIWTLKSHCRRCSGSQALARGIVAQSNAWNCLMCRRLCWSSVASMSLSILEGGTWCYCRTKSWNSRADCRFQCRQFARTTALLLCSEWSLGRCPKRLARLETRSTRRHHKPWAAAPLEIRHDEKDTAWPQHHNTSGTVQLPEDQKNLSHTGRVFDGLHAFHGFSCFHRCSLCHICHCSLSLSPSPSPLSAPSISSSRCRQNRGKLFWFCSGTLLFHQWLFVQDCWYAALFAFRGTIDREWDFKSGVLSNVNLRSTLVPNLGLRRPFCLVLSCCVCCSVLLLYAACWVAVLFVLSVCCFVLLLFVVMISVIGFIHSRLFCFVVVFLGWPFPKKDWPNLTTTGGSASAKLLVNSILLLNGQGTVLKKSQETRLAQSPKRKKLKT